jgi:peptide/nickel transport system substrate-binding protein
VYSFDLDKARQLLEEAGWVDTDGDGVREKNGERLHVVMISQPWALWQEPWGALLEQVGFEAEFVAPPVTEFREMVRTCATNMAPFGNNVSDPPQLKGVLHSEAVWGGPCHSDARLDELWEIGANSLDPEKRQAAWDEFQVRYMELALYAPIFPSAFYTGVSSQAKGLLFDGTQDIYFFYDVHLEP